MNEDLIEYLLKYKFKSICPENCGSSWYEKKYEIGAIGLKINVEMYKDNPIYTIQVRTLEDDNLDINSKSGYYGAMVEKGEFTIKTLSVLKKRYGIKYSENND